MIRGKAKEKSRARRRKEKFCHCGVDADVQLDETVCLNFYRVFSALLNKPSYLGCFSSDAIEPRALSRLEADVTNSPFRSCFLYCNAYQLYGRMTCNQHLTAYRSFPAFALMTFEPGPRVVATCNMALEPSCIVCP
ncbi:hypothetical protein HELRODRAFT_178957 [Helobdella robusta]|uniref:Uncharacterized protein n=1 Tax=Helobdella robusta TaxID=6412 RepID=T1FDY7_HELRO|nr:hypothetical protein HELRODRAFT_178957 [Helobdella robusta]ESN95776.1 hypothetical protein HELRODRAFT_178957 [Helobdella robusta]